MVEPQKNWVYRRSVLVRFLRSENGRIFVIGCLLLIGGISILGVMAYYRHPAWHHIFTMAAAHMAAGKGVSVVQGLALGLHPIVILMLATISDVILMLLVYPVFVFSYENFFESRLFQKHMRPMFESAQKRIDRIGRFKLLGVFIIVWLPLWMTGVIVGSIIGYLLGLRARETLSAAGLGTFTSILLWLFFSNQILSAAGWVDDKIVGFIVFALVAVLLVVRHIRRRRAAILANGFRRKRSGSGLY